MVGSKRNPGPGHYNPPTTFGRGSKAVSLHGKTSYGQTDEVPGPGEYAVSDKQTQLNKPKFGFGTSGRSQINSAGPGPGEYNPKDQRRLGQFTSRARRTSVVDGLSTTPGPGQYEIVLCRSGAQRAAVLGQKGNRWDMEVLWDGNFESPGPAAYSQENHKLGGARARSHGFGKAERNVCAKFSTAAWTTPGPGSYEPKARSKGPKISITPRRPEPEC